MPAREAVALQTLACWAGRFTPHVSLTPDTLLLEIGSCLRLFGGVRALVGTVDEAVQPLGFSFQLAAAPTPLAAEWLAQQGEPVFCTRPARLPGYLEKLPVTVLPRRAAEALQRFGVATLGEARRLPAAPLARRIGAEALQRIARAYGEVPDLRAEFVFPERFALTLPLPAVVEHAAALLFAARRLTSALSGWLALRQIGVRQAVLHLRHEHEAGETPLVLRFAEIIADEARFERVLRERLERLELVAPVDSLCLEASEVAPLPGCSGTLFNDPCAESGGMGALLERLGARLGEDKVFRVAVQDDHRPECATRRTPPDGDSPSLPPVSLPRPLWLLEAPEALREVDGRPWRRGPLELLAGPERIESGWWESGEKRDGKEAPGDLRRDYFIARSADERRLWIYRDVRAPGGWFLHGYFS